MRAGLILLLFTPELQAEEMPFIGEKTVLSIEGSQCLLLEEEDTIGPTISIAFGGNIQNKERLSSQ